VPVCEHLECSQSSGGVEGHVKDIVQLIADDLGWISAAMTRPREPSFLPELGR
jgi:hypothetical protein